MILEELFIDDQQVDIKDTSIVRRYQTPYFSDVTKLLSDTTYTITLPKTERNKAIMEYLHEADMSTDFPYTLHYADYYCEGLQLIRNGEVKVLGDFEIQIVYGIDREKYLPLKETKLNEIIPNGTTILESDWVVNWNKTDMYVTGKKYKYLESISGERESDVEIVNGVEQPKVLAPEPFKSNQKDMTVHPFVLFDDILDLIITKYNLVSNIFDKLKGKNDGFVLGTNNGDVSKTETISLNSGGWTSSLTNWYIYPPNITGFIWLTGDPPKLQLNKYVLGLKDVEIALSLVVTTNIAVYSKVSIVTSVNGESEKEIYIFDKVGNTFTGDITFILNGYGDYFYIKAVVSALNTTHNVSLNGTIKTTNKNSIFSIKQTDYNTSDGYYDCLKNLPAITPLEFLQNLCVMYGCVIYSDFKIVSYDDFRDNIVNAIEWKNIGTNKKSEYNINSNAKSNYLKAANSKETEYETFYNLFCQNDTLTAEKDLHVLGFKMPKSFSKIYNSYFANIILYKQKVTKTPSGVTFSNEYQDSEATLVRMTEETVVREFNNSIYTETILLASPVGVNFADMRKKVGLNIVVISGLGTTYYSTYQNLIFRPIVKEVSVLLDFYESANIDFTKPIYIEEWGKYCMLLELTAPNKGLCEAKLLLINQTL